MKRGWRIFFIVLLSVFIITLIFVGVGIYYYAFYLNDEETITQEGGSASLKNPVQGLSDDEGVLKFNEDFVYYLLYSIKAYRLHNPPFSSNTPKIEFIIGNEVYNAEIKEGRISVARGEISNEDIIIITTKKEAIKMLRDKNYIEKSFVEGGSSFNMVGGKVELFSKGYLKLYEGLTGKKVTIKPFFYR